MNLTADSEKKYLNVEQKYHEAHLRLLEQYIDALGHCSQDTTIHWKIERLREVITNEKDAIAMAKARIAELSLN